MLLRGILKVFFKYEMGTKSNMIYKIYDKTFPTDMNTNKKVDFYN